MTCIAAAIDEHGTIYMGGDSAAMGNFDLTLIADGKISRVDECLIGITGSVRISQVVRYGLTLPPVTGDLSRYMATDFVNSLRDAFKVAGFARKDSEHESMGGALLVGVRSHLFTVSCDYGLVESLYPFAAVGCGEQIAVGALFANAGQPAHDRVLQALQAAERFNIGVRGPFNVELLAPYGESLDPVAA